MATTSAEVVVAVADQGGGWTAGSCAWKWFQELRMGDRDQQSRDQHQRSTMRMEVGQSSTGAPTTSSAPCGRTKRRTTRGGKGEQEKSSRLQYKHPTGPSNPRTRLVYRTTVGVTTGQYCMARH
ncbi:hypothetical protein KSP39_PZI007183 [Platanthera zijinensis]|uniref:Uncharacterized protein n=1 Tax=Platanthera zijinensis TaxID=2320716 RepID=A0AAP0BRR5_9ASPA